ncbi:hypothetical protein F5887DRAFT_925239 [Amanita rubescens]|nr:hypothetical protein F5887DRAFT_925239 [Amanita rubescens]
MSKACIESIRGLDNYYNICSKLGAKSKKAKKEREVGDGNNGEDSEGQETHGHRPSPDDAVAMAATDPGSSNINADSADTSTPKKHPCHESEAPVPTKKLKVTKNPITSPTSDTPPTVNDAQESDASPAPGSPTSNVPPAPAPGSPANDAPVVNSTSDTAPAGNTPGTPPSPAGNNTPGTDPDLASDPFTLDVPFQQLKTLAAVAIQSSSASNIGPGCDKKLPEVSPGEKTKGTKARKGKKLTVPEKSMTARFGFRNICARNWLQSNPDGLAETYKDYGTILVQK